jgi:hypothetical protein
VCGKPFQVGTATFKYWLLAVGLMVLLAQMALNTVNFCMQQRQSSVAAFIHYCFLARRDPEQARLLLAGVESSSPSEESELSELIEVSS